MSKPPLTLEELHQGAMKSLTEAKTTLRRHYWAGYLDGIDECIRRTKKLATAPPPAEGVVSEK